FTFADLQGSGCSVARLSRLLWEQEVASSNLATPTQLMGVLRHRRWTFLVFRSAMEKLTSIIFDCDGVLVDTERIMISVLLEMAAELGAEAIDLDEAVQTFSGRYMLETIEVLEARARRAFPPNFEADFRARAYDR